MKPRGFFQQAVVFEGGMAAVALALSFLFGLNLWDGTNLDGKMLFWVIAATLPLIACYFVFKLLPFNSLKEIDRLVRQMFREYMSDLAIWQFVVIALVAGFGEELLFRGLLQSGLINYFGNDFYSTANIVFAVSLLFGIGHAVTKMYFFLAFVISVYFGILLIQTENILIPITAHALYDLFVFLYIRYSVQSSAGSVQ